MKIYISGAVSNNHNYQRDFERAEKYLKKEYPHAEIFNPVTWTQKQFKNPENMAWADLMLALLNELNEGSFTHMFMIPYWASSDGAWTEKTFAEKMGITVIYPKQIQGGCYEL